jgi:hypothetical protein
VDDLRLVGLALVALVLAISLECGFRFAHLTHVGSAASEGLHEGPEARRGSLAVDHPREWLGRRREVLVDHVESCFVEAKLGCR